MNYANSRACQQQLKGIEAIDFFLARQCYQSLESSLPQPSRPMAFHLLLALSWYERQGHNCLDITTLANQRLWHEPLELSSGFHFADLETLQLILNQCAAQLDESIPLKIVNNRLYLLRAWHDEQFIADSIATRVKSQPLNADKLARVRALWPRLFSQSKDSAEIDWQQVAVANALGRQLTIICGGPGTGKTYTVARLLMAVLAAEQNDNFKILMAAPTGKAAQRLSESIESSRHSLQQGEAEPSLLAAIPQQASTLHRLLGYRPDKIGCTFNADNPLDCDLLLVDEVSMVDSAMMARLLAALPAQAMLVLLGDVDQLPSVGAGCVLADITRKEVTGYSDVSAAQINAISGQQVPVISSAQFDHQSMLRKSHRFSGEIGEIAQLVINCDSAQSWALLRDRHIETAQATQQQPLFYIDPNDAEAWISSYAVKNYSKVLLASSLQHAFEALAEFRILVATRQGDYGVEPLNAKIEQLLMRRYNGHEDWVMKLDHPYRGRPIMVTENDYGLDLFNGDIGLIWPDEAGRLMAWFETGDNRYRRISLARLPATEPVYAMTIHKTQGSEFGHVAMLLPPNPHDLLSPELLYTGITRARKQLTVISSSSVWQQALSKRIGRSSGLADEIANRL
ncbi:exodeoxyribonuclease V subunit alpha [Neiella marina]|uniref:RecBCD enzyme subunit RecD n=1 Tax=Neiella holothuriorum TaxID=2870530 RepID=A0ABS7EGX1_9GAMM|nr:exodeoxyribonuclease V subunit alpha [Neiella holothuriorum]MBW8191575.1 exodeoxyribonuclease V subunit alpha [Neiella holothuriorum]